jgi:multidrug transporter EmrE-like cation transporter
MKAEALALALLSILMSAMAQILLKIGMGSAAVQQSLGDATSVLLSSFATWQVLAGLALYGAGALVWLFVLARVDVSAAYPFVGLGIAVTAFAGVLLLNEPLSLMRVLGTGLVVAGVLLVGRS